MSGLTITNKSFYKDYPNTYNIDKKTFNLILEVANKITILSLIKTGFFVRLPHRLGWLGITKHKTTAKTIDYTFLHKDPSVIGEDKPTHTNKHSERYYARYKNITNKELGLMRFFWEFKSNRHAKRLMASYIKEENTISKYISNNEHPTYKY